ncbi:PAS domain S-box protein [Nocardioides sp. SOB77]|uniref:histidine kinase n=1 Tax=Nocardioides oceani TaxID=3058369 RepID=A0ABT8FIW2_9ACTN|nr:ATP-binding protein [Nocardioides oceani]MDN4174474.1 PAS domain S-box protein [Nocardioides oceani]
MTVEHSPVGMALVDAEGRMVTVNQALGDMLGYTREELLTVPFAKVTADLDLESNLRLFQEALTGQRDGYRVTKRYVRSDGEHVWGDLSVAVVKDAEGRPAYFMSQVVDVTERMRDQERLRAAAQLLENQRRFADAIVQTVDVGLVLLDADGRYAAMNRRHRDFIALAFPDGHLGTAGQEGAVFGLDGVPWTREQMPSWRAAHGEEFDDVHMWVGRDPLLRRALSVSARSVRDPDGTFAGAGLAYTDITDVLQALQVKDDFIAAVSHELRTPLAAVRGRTELLASYPDQPPEVRADVAALQRNTARLERLVSDLIQAGQLQSGALHLRCAAYDVVAVAAEAVAAAEPGAAAAGVALSAALDDGSGTPRRIPAFGDAGRVRQVLDNLLSNAVKYTADGGSVTLEVYWDDEVDEVELVLADTGLGIPPADLDRVFERFYRCASARQRGIEGLGLGLSITRALVEAHGGHVLVESEVGVGTTFTVRLPRLAASGGHASLVGRAGAVG